MSLSAFPVPFAPRLPVATRPELTIPKRAWLAVAALVAASVAVLPAHSWSTTAGSPASGSTADATASGSTADATASGSTADATASAVVDPDIDMASQAPVGVVVMAAPGQEAMLADAVRGSGGRLGRELPLVGGVEAELTGAQVAELARVAGVVSITLDRSVRFENFSFEEATTASNFAKTTGATQAWAGGNLGEGVGVALIDTGVSSMNDFGQRVVFGPDLSGEGRTVDTNGHGTVMAGLIAGDGTDSAGRAGGAYTGVAPRSHVVSIKVAGRNGSVDVSTMLQAMHWVSAYKDQYNIRVLNLSWGTPSKQDPSVDPINYAVQRLWKSGIVVVVAAGNNGPSSGTVTKPGDDPMVVTVGSYDDKQNLDPADDSLSSWSSRGPTAAGVTKPDVVAPGRSLVATRSFGSAVEADNPKALISPSYIRGSGSSQAAAVTSGLAALLVKADPSLTPDQVKALLTSTASPMPSHPANAQGAGRVQVAAALSATPGPASWQTGESSGLGSIDASRGGWYVETDCGNDGTADVIRGEIDVRCEPWNGTAWTGTAWTGTAWTGTAWTGGTWNGTAWTGTAWTGTAWTGTAWTGGTWNGTAWTGTAWTGTAWTGTAWTGTAWTGSMWAGTAWTGTAWTGTAWTGAIYEEDTADGTFLTAFWGPRPKAGQHLPGEVSERSADVLGSAAARAAR